MKVVFGFMKVPYYFMKQTFVPSKYFSQEV